MAELDNFVGRENEREEFQKLLKNPKGNSRILLLLGPGGIGKTLLEKKMLEEAAKEKVLAPKEPIDLFYTDYQYIDGIQVKIKEIIERLVDRTGEQGPFAEFVKRSTSKQFHICLQKFCKEHTLVLAFDSFEYLDKVASDWLFEDDDEGLQVPGLICIIASRINEKSGIEKYRANSLAKEKVISGLELDDAVAFYQKIENEFKEVDLLKELLIEEGIQDDLSPREAVEPIWQITSGRPLLLEMVFRWSGSLLGKNSLVGLTADDFEKRLMGYIREPGEMGLLNVGSHQVSQPEFDTLVCMAYATRRFDEKLLQFLIDNKHIKLADQTTLGIGWIVKQLENYFFVKKHKSDPNDDNPPIIQLHDEMARLVQKYLWFPSDRSGDRKREFYNTVINYYDQLISQPSNDLADTLRIEKLYYTFQLVDLATPDNILSSQLEAPMQVWRELAELNNENINKFLPGEIESYIKYYPAATQFEINSTVAGMERNAQHFNQAIKYWENARKLGEEEKNDKWVVDALIGIFNCKSQEGTEKTIKDYLFLAEEICESSVPEMLPRVYYEIGLAYRGMYNIKKSLDFYEKAKAHYQKYAHDELRRASILNDMGYAYSFLGEWDKCTKNVKAALTIRQTEFQDSQERCHEVEKMLDKATSETEQASLRKELDRAQARLITAKLYLGFSHNTLGEVCRHQGDSSRDALSNYDESYNYFKEVKNYAWQARALNARGETHRRLAQDFKGVNQQNYQHHMEKAKVDTDESLLLCEKYQLKDDYDTAYRRLGRVVHDLALDQGDDKNTAAILLEQAHDYFQQGLEHARNTKDVLEELENLVELAFLLDDAIVIFGSENVPTMYREALKNLEDGIKKHRKDKPRIYHFPVLENLLKLEQGATYHAERKYAEALVEYLDGYKGLALQPGYGHARYKQHFAHLIQDIKLLDDQIKEQWCNTFIQVWENTIIPKTQGKTLAQEMSPDLIVECTKQLNIIARRK